MDKTTHPYFVPDDTQGSRKETAILLTGTATEFGIHQREVASVRGGFRISEDVYKALGWDQDEDDDTVGEDSVSGNIVGQAEKVTGPSQSQPGADEDGFGGDAPEPADEPETEPSDEQPVEEPTEDEADEDGEDGEDGEEPVETPDYAAWEYADLQAEVARRDLTPASRKAVDLIAALEADDETSTADED